MQINATFDANLSATAQIAINNVLGFFVNTFTDNVTVNIKFQFGASGLGESSTALVGTYTYLQIKRALHTDSKSSDDASSLASLPASDPISGAHSYYLTKAQAKALGLQAPDSTLDGIITLSNHAAFDFDRTNGISAGAYDFQGIVAHEISEVMGRAVNAIGSNVASGPANAYFVLDLFKFTGPGAHSFNGTTPGYFSTDNGVTYLFNFNTDPNGDFGDWANGPDAAAAFISPGVESDFSTTDVRVMDTLGWNTIVASTIDARFHPVRAWDFSWDLVASGDFNHDGSIDVIWENRSGVLGGWLMNNDQLAGTLQLPIFPGWDVIASGDFNQDGITDIMWQGAGGLVAEWFMGNGTVQGTATIQNMTGWQVIATGDFNHDGITDLIWDNGNGVLAGWLMGANGQIAGTLQLPFFPGWTAIATGDFNKDGTTDVLWQNADGLAAAWLMGNGMRQATVTLSNAMGWNFIATGDFNGDGTDDVMWRNADGITAAWFIRDGQISQTKSYGPTTGQNAVASGDLNHDGTSDLMWQNTTTGDITIWLFDRDGNLI